MPRKPKQRRKKTYEEWTSDLVRELKNVFYLHGWRLRVFYVKDKKESDDGAEVVASMGSDTKYMDATLRLFPLAKDMFKNGQLSSLGQDITHEFAHIITDPLYKIACNAVTNREGHFLEEVRERSTQETAVIVWSLLPKRLFSIYATE